MKKVKTSDITRTVSTKRRIEFAAPRLIKSTECQFHALFNEQANKNIPRELINSTQYPVGDPKSQRFVFHFSNDSDGIICVSIIGRVTFRENAQSTKCYLLHIREKYRKQMSLFLYHRENCFSRKFFASRLREIAQSLQVN